MIFAIASTGPAVTCPAHRYSGRRDGSEEGYVVVFPEEAIYVSPPA